ncbi:hypothetical protein [Desulfuromonas sp.]|uniref:hypothetical protein n=1 Tax=Desulfuromonas sp. TaxID=892 RepID=UPI0025C0B303|nr:hypothetical protein [Desulfuromonas sp.]
MARQVLASWDQGKQPKKNKTASLYCCEKGEIMGNIVRQSRNIQKEADSGINLHKVINGVLLMAIFLVIGFTPKTWSSMFTYTNKFNPTEWWELVSLLYTLSFSVIVYFQLVAHLFLSKTAMKPYQVALICAGLFLIPIVVFVSTFFLGSYVINDRTNHADYLWYYGCVLLVAIIYLIVDTAFAMIDESSSVSQESSLARTFADLPMVVALSILFVVVYQASDTHSLHATTTFTGGALAFQMWLSNIVFIVIQGNLFWPFLNKCCANVQDAETLENKAH